jgi:hypothetical protein
MDTSQCVCRGFCSLFTIELNVQRLLERHEIEIPLPDSKELGRWALFGCPLASLVTTALESCGAGNLPKVDHPKIRLRRTDSTTRPVHDLRLLTLHVDDRQHCYLGVYAAPGEIGYPMFYLTLG